MDARELLRKIIASGADENGIRDRFGDNADLYERCFFDFMEDTGMIALRDAIHTRSYEQAFQAAHALKGLSGNLGITGFYQAIRILTESLRNAQYDGINEEYAQVECQYELLKHIISEERPTNQEAISEEQPTKQEAVSQEQPTKQEAVSQEQPTNQEAVSQEQPTKQETISEEPPHVNGNRTLCVRFRSLMKDKNSQFLIYLLCATIVIFAVVGYLFGRINSSHGQNVVAESGQHLIEINNQIKLYIEKSIDIDWKITQSVGDSILGSAFVDDDSAVFDMLQRKQTVWGVSDLILYAENGYSIHTDGSTEVNDIASLTVYHAREHGRNLSIVDSSLIFTVPLDTTLTFHGSKIVAISVVRDISSFLDEMDISSFGEAAWMYLTDQNGIVLSSLSRSSAVDAFNIRAVIQEMEVMPLDKDDVSKDFIHNSETSVFQLTDNSSKLYGVSVPIITNAEPMNLFYFVPVNVVNSIMSGFSQQLMTISMLIIALFAVVAFASFAFMYNTRKRMFDKAIQTREKMFDLLIKNTKTAFGLFTVNRPQPEYQSVNTEEVIGELYWTLEKTDAGFRFHNDKRTETDNIALVNEALRDWDGKSIFRSGYLCNRRSATPTYFVCELYPVDDGVSDFVAIAQDFTAVYAREETVNRAMESARQANDAKTRFLSSMSHDIRTPMNAIINMSSFALENIDQPQKLVNYLRTVHESAEHLLQLINDVLDMSRIESGQLVIASAPFDVREEMERQADIIRPLCSAKHQTLITDFSGLEQTKVTGDALKLSQIVINLLSNAMKFTPEKGAVRFIAKEIPSLREDTVTLRFTVEDNGIGIPEADIKRVFEPFTRSDDKAVSKIQGTGLGLSIVKNYIEAMGGTIRCESEYREGSIFTVELPLKKADLSTEHSVLHNASVNESFLGMHALVAEDNHTNQIIAKEMLERMGFILDFVDDGASAVQKFCESKPYTYDVIYMDIQMPVMNGIAATVEIRASSHLQAKSIPIIAMTANAFADDTEKAWLAGMDGYVVKPISSSAIVEQTSKAIKNKKGVTK